MLIFDLEYAIWKAQQNKEWLNCIGVSQFLVFANYVNLVGENINAIKKKHTWLVVGICVGWSSNKCRGNQVYDSVF